MHRPLGLGSDLRRKNHLTQVRRPPATDRAGTDWNAINQTPVLLFQRRSGSAAQPVILRLGDHDRATNTGTNGLDRCRQLGEYARQVASLHQKLENPAFAGPQHLGPMKRGHILADRHDREGLSILVNQSRGVPKHPHFASRTSPHGVRIAPGFAAGNDFADLRCDTLPMLRGKNELEVIPSHRFIPRIAEYRFRAAVPHQDRMVRRKAHNGATGGM